MITLVSTPQHVVSASPSIITRWLATESPNLFRFKREDQAISSGSETGGFLQLTLPEAFVGNVGDQVAIYTSNNEAMNIGLVTAKETPATTITTDIPWVAGTVATFLNNNTIRDGYYFEARLTINGVIHPITVIAYPNTLGIADLNVSGILQIMVALGKSGDYSALVIKEPLKSGKFTLEYREAWFGSDEAYTDEGNTWYYAEVVRSEEQGSNLHEYVATEGYDAKFLNSFERPVYFLGLPFDISFILPARPAVSPAEELQVTTKKYNQANTLLATDVQTISKTSLEGYVNSLSIDPASIEAGSAYMTIEIQVA